VRAEFAARLEGKLVAASDVMALTTSFERRNDGTASVLVGPNFRLNDHAPTGVAQKLYVNAAALLGGDFEGRYRDDLVFFTQGDQGRTRALSNSMPGQAAHSPPANSWAAPNAVDVTKP
jgi:hypothetical protein